MEISSEHRSCHLSLEQLADIFLGTCWHGILSKRTGISLCRSFIWGPIPYKVLLPGQHTCFQQRHICLRSRRSLKISQRQPFGFVVSRRPWKSFSWISDGWRRTLKLWRGGCSMHTCTSSCRPFRELVNLGSAAFAKSQGEARTAAELFALLGVLVSSGPVCTFHLSFSSCLWEVCSYLL